MSKIKVKKKAETPINKGFAQKYTFCINEMKCPESGI